MANNLPPYSHSLRGRDKVTTERPRKPVKTWTDQDVVRLFFQERNPVKTFPMRNAGGVFLAVPDSITRPLANTTSAAWRRGCAIEARPAQARSVCMPAVPEGIARQRLHAETERTLYNRRPRTTPDMSCATLRQPPEATGGLARIRRARLAAWPWNPRPVFRVVGREDSRPGSEKPAKAEPMKDEIRLSGKETP